MVCLDEANGDYIRFDYGDAPYIYISKDPHQYEGKEYGLHIKQQFSQSMHIDDARKWIAQCRDFSEFRQSSIIDPEGDAMRRVNSIIKEYLSDEDGVFYENETAVSIFSKKMGGLIVIESDSFLVQQITGDFDEYIKENIDSDYDTLISAHALKVILRINFNLDLN